MKRLRICAVLALSAALSGCHTLRGASHPGEPPPAPAESSAPAASGEPQPESPTPDTSNPEDANSELNPSVDANVAALAPCLPIDNTIPKIKQKAKPVRKKAPPQQPPAPQVAEASPDGIVDAQVEPLPVSVMSILGKKVQSPKGDDLGRVVDVLADSGGRVRVAIIDFGGFLGVGDRRIAVDWPLLRFNPDQRDPSLLLSLSREKLKSAPEYRDNPRPQTLMEPATSPAPAAPVPAASPPASAPAAAPAPAPAPTTASPATAPSGSAASAPSASPPPSAATPPANDPKK